KIVADQRWTTAYFVAAAREVHMEGHFDYGKVDYKAAVSPVIIGCLICHTDFRQTPDRHLRGQGCPTCAGNVRKTNKCFVTEARSVYPSGCYDYSKTQYVRNADKVIITCLI